MPSPTIFIVEDDEADRCSLVALLQSLGFNARACASAPEFLETYKPQAGGCLLLDLRLPGMGGLELQQRMHDVGIMLPVVVMTAFGDVPTAVQAMKAGAVDFIEKPFLEDVLLKAIAAALDQDREAAERAAWAADIGPRIERLTPREREVFAHLIRGAQNKEIAFSLGISPRTVEIHRSRVMEKMEAHNLPQLIRMALAAGWDSL